MTSTPTARPDTDQPGTDQPESAQPESAQPESAQPESAQPESAQPEAATVPEQKAPQSKELFPPLPPPPPSFMATRWAGPSYGGGPAAWMAALIGGVAAAIALPMTRPGIGWFLVGLTIIATVAHATRFGPRRDSRRERLIQLSWAVLALALLSVGTFLNAYWLHYICALGAVGCFALAVAGGQSVRAILYSAFTPLLASFRAIPWLIKGASAWSKARDKQTTASRTGVAVLTTVLLLVVFGSLFAWADAAFANILGSILPDLNLLTIFQMLFKLTVGALLTAGAVFIVLAPPDLSGLERPASRRIGMVELVLPLGALVVLFAGFVAVQLSYLFSRTAPRGLSFSTYAVQGFGQLLVVTLLTLLVIACAARWAPKDTGRERVILRSLLAALVVLSLVIVASAVYRMWLYMDALGWTRERLFFGAVEIYLGFMFLLVIVAGVKLRAAWFPRAAIASFAIMLLGLAAINPEAYIARQNINRFEAMKENSDQAKLDIWYLKALTSDAIGELAQLDEPYRSCALSRIKSDLEDTSEQWYSWNLSRQHALAVIEAQDIDPQGCKKWDKVRVQSRR